MRTLNFTLLTPFVLTLALASPGCDEGEEVGMVGGRAYPPAGSYVHVQFRRQFLGLAGEKGTNVMGEGAGLTVASSGELRRVTEEFVVLAVDGEPTRELWIPRDVILMLDVTRRAPQQQPQQQ